METKCITFYSYKGGSGRSTTAINTVRALAEQLHASKDKPILLVDADLESAGLTYYFNAENKFCEKYTIYSGFHTTHILNGNGRSNLPFLPAKAETNTSAPQNLLSVFSDENCFGLNADTLGISPKELFDQVALPQKDWRMFCGILDDFRSYKRHLAGGKSLRYDPRSTVDELFRLHINKNLSPSEKAAKKADAILALLPTRVFYDISEHFGCAAGTVRFLGVDVQYKEAQIARNDTTTIQIENLIDECSDRNYAAIVFDSGAGTQSTAHALHQVSDVIIYCMRPSQQFIKGTRSNLHEYKEILTRSKEEHKEDDNKKNVIILPTAVPRNTELLSLSADSFEDIQDIATVYQDIVDATFCNATTALCEVEVFKFREQILGTVDPKSTDENLRKILERYADPKSSDFPKDAKAAYETYGLLAQKIIENCEVNESC